MKSLGVLPGSPPKVLRRSKAPKATPVKTVLSSITNEGPSRADSVLQPSDPNEGGPPINHSIEDSHPDSILPLSITNEGGPPTNRSVKSSSRKGSTTHSVRYASHAGSEIPKDNMDMNIDSRGRSHLRSSPSSRTSRSSSTSSSVSRSSSTSRTHMKCAPFFNDIIPTGRPAIKDYSPCIRRRLVDTVFIYENWVLSNDGFPDKELQYAWAREAWFSTCREAQEQFKLSECMIKMVGFIVFRLHLAVANFIRSRLEDHAFVVTSKTSSGRSFQVLTILTQVQAGLPFLQTSSDIFISWKIENFTTRCDVACAWNGKLTKDFYRMLTPAKLCFKRHHRYRPSKCPL